MLVKRGSKPLLRRELEAIESTVRAAINKSIKIYNDNIDSTIQLKLDSLYEREPAIKEYAKYNTRTGSYRISDTDLFLRYKYPEEFTGLLVKLGTPANIMDRVVVLAASSNDVEDIIRRLRGEYSVEYGIEIN